MEQESLQKQSMAEGEHSPVEPSAPVEKMLPESQVNEIVKRRLSEQKEKLIGNGQSPQSQTISHSNTGFTPEQLRAIAAEEAEKHYKSLIDQQQQQYKRQEGEKIAQEFISKLESGKSNYEDFDSKVGSLPFADIPHIIQLSNSVDNTADVMYELAENPAKIGNLTLLANINPALAYKEMQKLSASIKANQAAKSSKTASEPLSQLKSSPIGSDNGSMSVSDYRKIFR